MKPLLSLLSIALVVSCVHLNPRIKVDNSFRGLDNQTFVEPSFLTNEIDSKYIFVIHGIGSQKNNYSYKIMRSIAKYSGIGSSVKRTQMETKNLNTQLEKTEYFNQKRNKRLVFYTIKWSDLTESPKKKIEHYEHHLSSRFHGFSKFFKKKLMYYKVADAFLAQGPNCFSAIEMTIDIAMRDLSLETNDLFNLKELNLISGSFGSQLFIKYFYDYYDQVSEDFFQSELNTVDTLGFDYNEWRDTINIEYADTTIFTFDSKKPDWWGADLYFFNYNPELTLNFYMLTNQLNLMDGSVENWGGLCEFGLLMPNYIKKVNVVAFRNTNDFLCYYVPKETVKKYFRDETEVNVTNSYYWNFILRNNALHAHTAVFKLNKLAKAITKGSNGISWVKEVDTKRK